MSSEGTSAVAPLWSGLVALLNQKLGHSLGYMNPLLYEKLSSPVLDDFHDVTTGNNGAYPSQDWLESLHRTRES